jgi:hypothetical protein
MKNENLTTEQFEQLKQLFKFLNPEKEITKENVFDELLMEVKGTEYAFYDLQLENKKLKERLNKFYQL